MTPHLQSLTTSAILPISELNLSCPRVHLKRSAPFQWPPPYSHTCVWVFGRVNPNNVDLRRLSILLYYIFHNNKSELRWSHGEDIVVLVVEIQSIFLSISVDCCDCLENTFDFWLKSVKQRGLTLSVQSLATVHHHHSPNANVMCSLTVLLPSRRCIIIIMLLHGESSSESALCALGLV